jgi:WD repeat-containing protein 68
MTSSSRSSSAHNGVATYTAPWPVYALAWSSHTASPSSASSSSSSLRSRGHSFTAPTSPSRLDDAAPPYGARLAIGSLMEEYSNSMQVLGYIGERDAAG